MCAGAAAASYRVKIGNMVDFDAVVIGAGVIGLAVARELAEAGHSLLVLEANADIGMETSSRNSEVIHAGLYYPEGSLKARLCLEGRERLYAYCESRSVPHRRCGKLIVATDANELQAVAALKQLGNRNGVDDLVMLSAAEVRKREPMLQAVGALSSPSTGIVDSHAFMLSLQGDAENAGALFAFLTPFARAEPTPEGFNVHTGGSDPTTISSRWLVNASGLQASALANRIEGIDSAHIPVTRYCKGNYFTLSAKAPFSTLIYPAPHSHGLGLHLTFDLGGQARFGPDTEWIESPAYEVDPSRLQSFEAAIRRYWPGLPAGHLNPGYAGIRPKITGPDEAAADFRIDGPETHGVDGLVNLFGIESPGLTSSLAIGTLVRQQLCNR